MPRPAPRSTGANADNRGQHAGPDWPQTPGSRRAAPLRPAAPPPRRATAPPRDRGEPPGRRSQRAGATTATGPVTRVTPGRSRPEIAGYTGNFETGQEHSGLFAEERTIVVLCAPRISLPSYCGRLRVPEAQALSGSLGRSITDCNWPL